MSRLLLVDPHNPTVFDECIACTRSPLVDCSDLIGLFDGLRARSSQDTLIQANYDFYTAKVLIGIDRLSAREHLAAAQKSFRKVFPRGHQVFAAIRSALRELYKTN